MEQLQDVCLYRAWTGLAWTDLILSQVSGEDRHAAYRRMVQGYLGEEKKLSEDIHMGLVAGTKKFALYIKKKYMQEKPNEEIPLQKMKKEDYGIEDILEKASNILECDFEVLKTSPRISQANKLNRDILIYLLWKTGAFTNKEIASHFGLCYSAVSRRVSICNDMIKSNKDFIKDYNSVKSLIKM